LRGCGEDGGEAAGDGGLAIEREILEMEVYEVEMVSGSVV
jgi:hypothetical protein